MITGTGRLASAGPSPQYNGTNFNSPAAYTYQVGATYPTTTFNYHRSGSGGSAGNGVDPDDEESPSFTITELQSAGNMSTGFRINLERSHRCFYDPDVDLSDSCHNYYAARSMHF
jgi:hypothetical protein